MSMTKAFVDAVEAQNIRKIRIMMEDSLLVDLTFREYKEMERLSANVPGLYDEHDGQAFITDSSDWNDGYMNKLMVQAIGNFSHERLNHLQEVVHYLRPAPKSVQAPIDRASHSTDYKTRKAEDDRSGDIVRVVGGTAAGALIGGVVAAVAGTTTNVAVMCAVAGAAVGAGVASAMKRARK